jgi:hypothetical protein
MWEKIGGVLLVLIVVTACGDMSSGSGQNLSSAEPDFKVSCSAIASEVEANEARASAKYSDKVIQISGRVDSIDEDMWGDPIVNLSDGQEYSFNSCRLSGVSLDVAISLNKGQSVSFKCNDFSELIGSASLSNCT